MKRSIFTFLLLTPLLFFITLTTHAQSQNFDTFGDKPVVGADGTIDATKSGFVPCSGITCSPCDLVVLFNTVLKWFMTMAFLLFAVLAILAGFKLISSGGNPGALKEAKGSFTNAFIGLLIILSAWLIVDTLLRKLLPNGNGEISGYGPWSSVQCATQTVATIEESYFSGDPVYMQQIVLQNGGTLPPLQSAGGACNPTFVGKYFPNEIGNAQCIITKESSCGARLESVTDRMSYDRRAFSFGPMQINITQHQLYGCGSGTLNCPAAFSGKNYSARVTNETLYQQCASAAKNFDCNFKNGKIIKDNRGSWKDWSTAKPCGLVQ